MVTHELESESAKERLYLLSEEPYTLPLARNLAFRVYPDSRPHNLEIARLQKGLVLTLNEIELIEEGVGFGVPVAIFSDETYFSGSSQVTIVEKSGKKIIIKHFHMDTISKKGLKDGVFVDSPLYRLFADSLANIYRDYPDSRRVIFPLIRLRNKFGIKTLFTKAEPRGEVAVTYSIKRNEVVVNADLTMLDKRHCEKVLILNEQGSTFFRRFRDSNGLTLSDSEIGAWDLVKANSACFSDWNNTLSFCLRNLPNARLFRGREHIAKRLSWAGMGYELNPNRTSFNYKLKFEWKQ